MTKRNEAIGTVECPMKGCTATCEVFRFRERGDSEKSVANRRFAGKLYLRCPKHGQVNVGGGDPEMQEYILCNASMHAPAAAGDRQPSPASTTPAAPAKKTPATSSAAVSTSPAKASETPPATTKETPAKSKGWGFFE